MVVSKEEGQKWAPIAKAQLKKQVKMYQADVRKQAAGAKKAEEAAALNLAKFRKVMVSLGESIEVIGVQGVASLSPLHSTDYAKSTPGSLNAVTQFLHSAGGPYPYVSPEF